MAFDDSVAGIQGLAGTPSGPAARRNPLDLFNITNAPGFTYDPLTGTTLIGDLDPFIGTAKQTSRMRAYCQIMIDGTDVTDKMFPYLISAHITSGPTMASAELELDDRDGSLPIPLLMSSAVVALGWETEQGYVVFNGWIEDIEHGFGRKQGGRRMWIHAKSSNQLSSKVKQPIQDNLGEGARPGQKEGTMHGLTDWLQQLAKTSGVQANITAALGKYKADYWSIGNASFMHEIENLSQKFKFKYLFTGQGVGRQTVLIESPGEWGLSCQAIWRDNLIGWRVRPLNSFGSYSGSTQQAFDPAKSAWNIFAQHFGLTNAPFDQVNVETSPQAPAANQTDANNTNQANQDAADTGNAGFGNGRIMINGEPKARWNSLVLLTGARPGVDGFYQINVVEHVYSRQGFITNLEVVPQGVKGNYSVYRSWLPKAQPNVGGQPAPT